jgi:hypothetical protein
MTRGRAWLGAMVGFVLLTACTSSDGTTENGTTENLGRTPAGMPAGPLPPHVEGLARGCPDPDVRPQFPPGGRLPQGATQVRVCNLAGDLTTFKEDRVELDFLVPVDALTTSVDTVVDLVNAAVPAADDGRSYCGGIGVPSQVLWFSYAETDLAVTYNDGTCDDLDLGAVQVVGGDAVAAAFSELLWQQRAGQRPPPQLDRRARCAPNITEDSPLIMAEHLDLADAVVCEYAAGVRQARLTPAALDAVRADFTTTEGYQEHAGCPTRMMRGITSWGDRFTWWGTCWDFPISNTYPAGLHWQPAPTVAELLASIPRGPSREQVTTHPGRRR